MKTRTWFVSFVLIAFLLGTLVGCGESPEPRQSAESVNEVAFDLDDTLVFSTPAFRHAFNRDVEPFSDKFWAVVNSSDSQYSCVKPETIELLHKHRRKGREIYVITAREPDGARTARKFVETRFNIPRDHVYFEPGGKTERLRALGIDVYYGDSDSDIRDSQAANIKAVRIQRSPRSSYDEKYSPGSFGEKVLKNTAGHRCS